MEQLLLNNESSSNSSIIKKHQALCTQNNLTMNTIDDELTESNSFTQNKEMKGIDKKAETLKSSTMQGNYFHSQIRKSVIKKEGKEENEDKNKSEMELKGNCSKIQESNNSGSINSNENKISNNISKKEKKSNQNVSG